MKSLAGIFILVLLLGEGTADAGPFVPEKLKLSAYPNMHYSFGGAELPIQVHVSGTPATVLFFVYTNDKHYHINTVRNGNLGWHYVNKIDTCCYVSPPYRFTPGDNTITWNGRNNDGRRMYSDTYTYYLWGYDGSSPAKKVTDYIRFPRFDRSFIQTLDSHGIPLDRPALYDASQSFNSTGKNSIVRTKWVIGGDPSDASLGETTTYTSWVENSRLALDSRDASCFFTQSLRSDGTLMMSKWKWVSNGQAILQPAWGDNGYIQLLSGLDSGRPLYSGPVSDGFDFLFCVNIGSTVTGDRCNLNYIDGNDGTLLKTENLTSWWTDEKGEIHGPSAISFANGMLFLNSPLFPIAMMIDPYVETSPDLVRWANGNGDGVGDKALNLDYSDSWICTDPARTPVAGAMSADQLRFSIFPVEGISAASFGVFAPDGTGLGYFPLPGMEKGSVYGLHIVDYGSAYDGIYYGGVSNDGDMGVWYTTYDAFRGIIADYSDYWGDFIFMRDPGGGDVIKSGSSTPINWGAEGIDVVRIEFSPDNGVTWTAIADSVAASAGSYSWTVPDVTSSACHIRISDRDNPATYDINNETFTITGASGVAEDAVPRAFSISNRPNPFNPSTTITFTLPASGRASLILYDITGRKVRELLADVLPVGPHAVEWDGKDETGTAVASGVYITRLSMGKFAATGKMLLVR